VIDFTKIVDGIKAVLALVFGNQVPQAILNIVGYGLLLGLLLCAVWGFLYTITQIRSLWTEKIRSIFYNQEERVRGIARQRFSEHVITELNRLENLVEWRDYKYGELEAEVETEGRRRSSLRFFSYGWRRSKLRRERSLTKALRRTAERVVLLEGDPGSGKSVAMRHVARTVAARAKASRGTDTLIPIYVNLRGLEHASTTQINADLIRNFILRTLNRGRDRDVEKFLNTEFDLGLEHGTWFFLFDSFDELPGVLSSTEQDNRIAEYSEAISDFLHGFNNICKGIVASRGFRGPGRSDWPRFRILPLSDPRQFEIIRKANLAPDIGKTLRANLLVATNEIRAMAANPMFLGLLCRHVEEGFPFPGTSHRVFETYIDTRLRDDRVRLHALFNVDPEDIRRAAECIAFCMTNDPDLSLNASRDGIAKSLDYAGFGSISQQVPIYANALEALKLAKSESIIGPQEAREFTFSHRRFQEYFATCFVLRDPTLIAPNILLTDGRWRETAVVLCQSQAPDTLGPLLAEAHRLLSHYARILNEQKVDPDSSATIPVNWPRGVFHVLNLLQDGFAGKPEELSDAVRIKASEILDFAKDATFAPDLKWAVEVAGILPQENLIALLRTAFANRSQWVNDMAFQQTGRLLVVPDDIRSAICRSLVRLAMARRLYHERFSIHAYIARLKNGSEFRRILSILLSLRPTDIVIHIFIIICLLMIVLTAHSSILDSTVIIIGSYVMIFTSLSIPYRDPFYSRFGSMWAAAAMRLDVGILLLLLPYGVMSTSDWLFDRSEASKILETFDPLFWVVLFIAILYLTIWAPMTAISCLRTSLGSLLLWPVRPLIALREASVDMGALMRALRTHWRRLGLWTLGIVIAYAAAIAAIFWLSEAPVSNQIAAISKQMVVAIFAGVTAIAVIVSIVFAKRSVARARKELQEYRRRADVHLDEDDFINYLKRLRTKSVCMEFCVFVRTHNALAFSDLHGRNLIKKLDNQAPKVPIMNDLDIHDEVYRMIENQRDRLSRRGEQFVPSAGHSAQQAREDVI
jgi:hypothetical protein